MKSSWFPILLVTTLLALLIVLGGLQYVWLGKIGEGERARLQKTLESDTQRFAEDFNREIQGAYFTFQLDADVWKTKNYVPFNDRFDFWRVRTAYPNLIKDFYFLPVAAEAPFLTYDRGKRGFLDAQRTAELEKLRDGLAVERNFAPFDKDLNALIVPVREAEEKLDRIIIRTNKLLPEPPIITPKKIGFLVIVLDEAVLENHVLPDLAQKYFSDGEMANYKIAVKQNATQKIIFQTQNGAPLEKADAAAALFNPLSSDNLQFFLNKNFFPSTGSHSGSGIKERGNVIVSQRFETRSLNSAAPQAENGQAVNFEIQKGDEKPRVAIINRQSSSADGIWTLQAQHADGSLEQFIANTRRKNLAIVFGILSLLGVSIVLIFVSAQRAKLFAQRQIDFVSAVSHEFRTPLAVIYSAGENLTDGVVNSERKIAQYGNLIKREGKKLSQMVEQILEFAGARSGNRKYDLRSVDVLEIIEDAMAQCKPLLDEKEFQVEKNFAENLSEILADKNALSQAVQNLITNAVKYSNGDKWLKISAVDDNAQVKITVEDKGIGIAPPDLKKIFEPFYRSKKVIDAQIHGNGLGLSLVKQTIEAHGGRVSAESAAGKGSRITIHLPFIKFNREKSL